MASLVAYYSRADENYFGGVYRYVDVGNTEKIARMIADDTGADMFKIEMAEPYAADYDTCIEEAKADQKAKRRPKLVRLPESIDKYDEIYLGYPIYWGDMPMAVYTFLEDFSWNGKTIHPFCTHEGSGPSGTGHRIKKICKGSRVTPVFSVTGSQAEHAQAAVTDWIDKK